MKIDKKDNNSQVKCMTDEHETENIKLLMTSIKQLDEKTDKFSGILEKFGLDIITKMGQTNLKINMLTDKINELSKATLDVKGLMPQLNKIIETQDAFIKELQLIKSLITNIKTSSPKERGDLKQIEKDESATSKKDIIMSSFSDLRELINETNDPIQVNNLLTDIKEKIFEFTGGHRILYEISQVITRLNNSQALSEPYQEAKKDSKSIKSFINEKIPFWINKIQ
jgi:hypothetical protein